MREVLTVLFSLFKKTLKIKHTMTAVAKNLKDNLKQLLMRLSLRRLELHGTKHGSTCMCIYFHFHFIPVPPRPKRLRPHAQGWKNEQVYVCVNVATKKPHKNRSRIRLKVNLKQLLLRLSLRQLGLHRTNHAITGITCMCMYISAVATALKSTSSNFTKG